MSVDREMTLAEWCAKLPSQHVVNRELAELTKQLATLAEQNEKMREALVMYSEATSEGYSGVFRACCASRPEEPHTHYCSCNKALSLPNLASPQSTSHAGGQAVSEAFDDDGRVAKRIAKQRDVDDVTAKACSKKIAELREQVEKLTKERDELKTVPMKYRRMQFNSELLDEVTQLQKQLDAIAEQNEKLKEALLPCAVFVVAQMESEIGTVSSEYPEVFEWAKAAMDQIPDGDTFISSMIAAKEVLSIPDLSSPVLNRIRAEALDQAAKWFNDHVDNRTDTWQAQELRRMAAELEKANG